MLKASNLRVYKVISFLFFLIIPFQILLAQKLYLKIEGETESETKILDSLGYAQSFPNFLSLQEEIETTNQRLQKIGFIENEVLHTLKINDSTYQSLFSLKTLFDTIYIYYPKNEISRSIFTGLSNEVTDDYFVTTLFNSENVLNSLSKRITENGQPFSSLKLGDLKKKNDSTLMANLKITRDKKRNIDHIVIKGYEKFPRSFIKHFLRIKKGKPFNLEKIKQKSEGLNALPFASQARTPEVLFTKDSTSIYFYIEKSKSNTFDGFLGFGTNESTSKIEFDGYLNLRLINNLNYGESFALQYKSDEAEQKTFDVELNLPYLFGSAVGTEFNLNIFKKDSTFTTVSQSAELFYQINKSQRIFLGINGLKSNNLLSSNAIQNVNDYSALFYTIKYDIFKLQAYSKLFPENFRLKLKIGTGLRNFEDNSEQQQIFGLRAFKIINLNDKNSVFINTSSAGIFSDHYFLNEMLRFGGINSIRGFEENSLTASLYAVLNTEYRYQLSSNIYVHSIFDAAYLDDNLSNFDQKLFGFGFGFGIITKAGLLKFNYANGKYEDQKFEFSNSKIHLSLNAKF